MGASHRKPSAAVKASSQNENSAQAVSLALRHAESLRKLMQSLADEADGLERTPDFLEAQNALKLAIAAVELRARALEGDLASAKPPSTSVN